MIGNALWPANRWPGAPWSAGGWVGAPWLDMGASAAPGVAATTAPAPWRSEAGGAAPWGGSAPWDPASLQDWGSLWGRFFGWGEAFQRRRRDLLDGALYDVGRLEPRSREALADIRTPHPVLVAHPYGRRALAVYPGAQEWGMSIDAGVRVLALVGPGSGPMAAAAFARHVADALGEPAAATPPSRRWSDLTLDLSAPMEAVWEDGPSAPADATGAAALLALARAGRGRFTLMVSHGLGGRLLAELLRLDRREGGRDGCRRATAGARLVMIGGAPAAAEAAEALHLIGGGDLFGWAISDPGREPWRVAPFAGGHLNPGLPGALPLEGLLGEAVAALGLPDRAESR